MAAFTGYRKVDEMMQGNSHNRLAIMIGLTALLLLLDGCISLSKGRLTFNELAYPGSISPYLYGPNSELVAKDRGLKVIKTFSSEKECWNEFYSLISFSGCKATESIALDINEAIRSAGGDGMVNITVTAWPHAIQYWHPLTLLPFWPSCTHVLVTGDIVKFDPTMEHGLPLSVQVQNIEDVLIREPENDETNGLKLHVQCRVLGNMETLFVGYIGHSWVGSKFRFVSPFFNWYDMVPAEYTEEPSDFDTKQFIRRKALEKGANVVQVVYWTAHESEVIKIHEAIRTAPSISHLQTVAALDLLYWNCPTLASH
jgi:hypothetical protein